MSYEFPSHRISSEINWITRRILTGNSKCKGGFASRTFSSHSRDWGDYKEKRVTEHYTEDGSGVIISTGKFGKIDCYVTVEKSWVRQI